MFGFSKKENNNNTLLTPEMLEIKDRFFAFLEKLEEKLKEFTEASVPELKELNDTDSDELKRGYHRMKSAVLGQLESIRKKASDVREDKITNYYTSDSKAYFEFRTVCYDRFNVFEAIYDQCRGEIEATYYEDFESQYQKILDEHETLKNKFHCVQCGSPITIDQIYFTTTYITCPACQTRNTFEPSSQAKMLEHLGRSLAEQRTAHLLKEHDAIQPKAHDLYLQRHTLDLSLIHEKDRHVIEQTKIKMLELENQKKELEQQAPILYQKYLRAMFNEWNAINPAMSESHEKFYLRILNEYLQTKKP